MKNVSVFPGILIVCKNKTSSALCLSHLWCLNYNNTVETKFTWVPHFEGFCVPLWGFGENSCELAVWPLPQDIHEEHEGQEGQKMNKLSNRHLDWSFCSTLSLGVCILLFLLIVINIICVKCIFNENASQDTELVVCCYKLSPILNIFFLKGKEALSLICWNVY